MLQDQDLGSRVWDNCKTVHRLNYFRACPVLHKPRSGWSPWAQILPVLVQDQDHGLTTLGRCIISHSYCDFYQSVACSTAVL